MSDRNRDVAMIVRMLMGLRALRQHDVADALGIHVSGISRALQGKRAWTLDDLDKLAELFDVPVAVFFDSPEVLLRSRCFEVSPGAELLAGMAA